MVPLAEEKQFLKFSHELLGVHRLMWYAAIKCNCRGKQIKCSSQEMFLGPAKDGHLFFCWNYEIWLFDLQDYHIKCCSRPLSGGAKRTWIFPSSPVLSILLATFTVLPQMSYWGFLAPITPAITGPWLMPVEKQQVIINECSVHMHH